MSRMHYGLPGLRAACGVYYHRLTTDRERVTCRSCLVSPKYLTEFFTTRPSGELLPPEELRHPPHKAKNGARP